MQRDKISFKIVFYTILSLGNNLFKAICKWFRRFKSKTPFAYFPSTIMPFLLKITFFHRTFI